MSILGNQSYTGIVNAAQQFSNITTSNLTAVNSVLDGTLNSAEYIYFTPPDFAEAANSRRRGVATLTPAGTGNTAFVAEAASQIVDVVAIKVIPKGFRIKSYDPAIDPTNIRPEVYSRANAGPAVNGIYIYEQPLAGQASKSFPSLGQTINPTWTRGVTIWTGAGTLSTGTTSDGSLCCVLEIDVNVGITPTNGFVGARVPIERVPVPS